MDSLFGDISKQSVSVVAPLTTAALPITETVFLCLDDTVSELLQEMFDDPRCYGITIFKTIDGRCQVSGNFGNRSSWNCITADDPSQGISTLHHSEKIYRNRSNVEPKYLKGEI